MRFKVLALGAFVLAAAQAQTVITPNPGNPLQLFVAGGTNGVVYQGASGPTATATGGAGTLCLTSANGGIPTWASCSGSAATAWSSLTAPAANTSLAMTTFTTTFTLGTGTSTNFGFLFQDTTANTGTGPIVQINSVGTSTMKPLQVTAQGTANGIQMSSAGVLGPIGTGIINANQFNGAAAPASANALSSNASGQLVASTAHNLAAPKLCLDSSGSGTAQFCATTPTFAPTAGDTIIYKTTTTNTGDLTINVNSSSAVHVRKWQGNSVLAAGDLQLGVYVLLTYDGTFWETFVIGNPPSAGAGCSASGVAGVIQASNGSGGCQATSLSDSGTVLTKVDGITTVGLGVPVVGWQSALANSSATSAVTLASSGVATGDYEIHYDLDLHTPCTTGTGQLFLSFAYAGNAARTITTGDWALTATQAASVPFSGVLPLHVVTGTAVTFTPTLQTACTTGTATWDGDVWMVRVN